MNTSDAPCFSIHLYMETASHEIFKEAGQLTIRLLVRGLMATALFVLGVIMWSVYHNNKLDPSLKFPLPPGSMGLPIIGETLLLMLRGNKFYQSKLEQYGKVYKTHILGSPVIRVIGAKNTKKILMNENNLVTAYWPASVRFLLGQGSVANAIGDLHRTRRLAVQKAFNHHAMSDYISVMQKVVKSYIQTWCRQDSVFGYQECKDLSFALAAEALVGFSLNPEELRGLIDVFSVFEENLFCLPVHFPGFGFAKGMTARKLLLHKIEECLEKKRQKMNSNDPSLEHDLKDAMSRLLKEQGKDSLTEFEIRDLCLELLFAGHATTASAATSILIYLSKYRDVIRKIQAELEEHGLLQSKQGDLSLANLGNLTYVTAVIKEVLRLSPPVGGAFRTVLKSFTMNGYQIPAGWTVAYSIRETQENADIFFEAEKFDPDRWIKHKYLNEKFHYLPFGGGPRSCVGKEFAKMLLRVFLVEIVRSSRWRLVNGSVRMKYLPVPHPADGLPVSFSEISLTNRSKSNTF